MNADMLETILDAAQVGESSDWEFKSARGGLPKSFWESYSAMANSDGGTILLGARENDGRVRLDGLTDEQVRAYKKNLWDDLHNRSKVSVNLLTERDIKEVPVEGGTLLAVYVPRAGRTQRPVYLGQNPFGHTFRRHHEGDYRCPDEEVRRMFADAAATSADSRILEHFGLDDLDIPSLTKYRQLFRSAKGDHPWLVLDDTELLRQLGGWRFDRAAGKDCLTVAGLLMFGKDLAIRDPEAAPTYFVDYREKLDPGTRWSDRICPDGTWAANLFQFYLRVWPRLTDGLAVPFQIEDGLRKEETPVHESLREAFVNALIHSDYTTPGGVVIERHRDKFVMENPGTLLVSLEQYQRGGVSECRNKALQKMFVMMGGGEQAGSGTAKIREGWRYNRWRAPLLLTQEQPDRVILALPMVSLIPENALRALRERFGADVEWFPPAELQALATAYLEGGVTNSRLQDLLVDHPVDITRLLKGLCQRGFLVSDNRRRWSRYTLGDVPPQPSLLELMTPDASASEEGCPTVHGDSARTPGDSARTPGDSARTPGDSTRTPGDSARSSEDSAYSLGDSPSLPEVEAGDEQGRKLIDDVASKPWISSPKMQLAIQHLCSGRFLTIKEIAHYLNRQPSGLRYRLIRPMVKKNILRLRYPDSPNRPDQAYTTADNNT